jgi:ribosomal protein L29
MKRKELTELRSKTAEALKKVLAEKKTEIQKARVGAVAKKEKSLKILKNLRREVAQTLTLIREKEILASLEPKKEEKK